LSELWLWQHIDPVSGTRRVTRYRLSEADAKAKLRDPVRVEGSLLIPTPFGSLSDFAVLADVRTGRFKETTWHLFRLTYFPAGVLHPTSAPPTWLQARSK
jgi:hypothetical protein